MDKFLIKGPKNDASEGMKNEAAAKLAQTTTLRKMTFESDSDEDKIIANVLKKPKPFYHKVDSNDTPQRRKSISLSLKKSSPKSNTEILSQIDDYIPLAQSTMIDVSQKANDSKVSSSQILGKISDEELSDSNLKSKSCDLLAQSEKIFNTDDELEFSNSVRKQVVNRNTSIEGGENDLKKINKYINEDKKLFSRGVLNNSMLEDNSPISSTYVIQRSDSNSDGPSEVDLTSQRDCNSQLNCKMPDKIVKASSSSQRDSLKKKINSKQSKFFSSSDSESDKEMKPTAQKSILKPSLENPSLKIKPQISDSDSDSDEEIKSSSQNIFFESSKRSPKHTQILQSDSDSEEKIKSSLQKIVLKSSRRSPKKTQILQSDSHCEKKMKSTPQNSISQSSKGNASPKISAQISGSSSDSDEIKPTLQKSVLKSSQEYPSPKIKPEISDSDSDSKEEIKLSPQKNVLKSTQRNPSSNKEAQTSESSSDSEEQINEIVQKNISNSSKSVKTSNSGYHSDEQKNFSSSYSDSDETNKQIFSNKNWKRNTQIQSSKKNTSKSNNDFDSKDEIKQSPQKRFLESSKEIPKIKSPMSDSNSDSDEERKQSSSNINLLGDPNSKNKMQISSDSDSDQNKKLSPKKSIKSLKSKHENREFLQTEPISQKNKNDLDSLKFLKKDTSHQKQKTSSKQNRSVHFSGSDDESEKIETKFSVLKNKKLNSETQQETNNLKLLKEKSSRNTADQIKQDNISESENETIQINRITEVAQIERVSDDIKNESSRKSTIYNKLKSICDDEASDDETHFKTSNSSKLITSIDEFRAQNKEYKEIQYETNFNFDEIESDDEIFLIQCPKLLNPQQFKGSIIDFDNNTTVDIEDTKFDLTISKNQNQICLIGGSKMYCLNTTGEVRISENLDENLKRRCKIEKFNDKVEFPKQLKIRHPLFGCDLKNVNLETNILDKLNEAEYMKAKILRKQKKRQRKSSKYEIEDPNSEQQEKNERYFEFSQFLNNLSEDPEIKKEKKKRKRSINEDKELSPKKKQLKFDFSIPNIPLKFEDDDKHSIDNSVDSGVQLTEENFKKKKKKKRKIEEVEEYLEVNDLMPKKKKHKKDKHKDLNNEEDSAPVAIINELENISKEKKKKKKHKKDKRKDLNNEEDSAPVDFINELENFTNEKKKKKKHGI